MSALAVNVAVIHENKILLTQREDFETWILPSGGVEDGESLAQAAIRETKEETGLDVEVEVKGDEKVLHPKHARLPILIKSEIYPWTFLLFKSQIIILRHPRRSS